MFLWEIASFENEKNEHYCDPKKQEGTAQFGPKWKYFVLLFHWDLHHGSVDFFNFQKKQVPKEIFNFILLVMLNYTFIKTQHSNYAFPFPLKMQGYQCFLVIVGLQDTYMV